MAQAIAIAAPRTEDVTRTVSMAAGAGITGLAEGMIVRIAPQMGAAAPVLTWGALIGVPTFGIFGALFTRGILGDVLTGVAAGGIGVLGYSLPEMISPTIGRRAVSRGNPVKLLAAGIPQRVQALAAASRLGQVPANESLIPIMEDQGILV
ncbi:hypothetical protein ES704_02725 [subsurface metagenome]|jgi:hypothetical protein